MSREAWFYFVAVGIIWGLPYFFIRIADRDLDPGTLVFLRTALASLILVPIAIRRNKWRALRGHLLALAAYTAGEMAIPWLLLTNAEKRVASSFAGLVIAVVPLIGAAFVFALGYERLAARRLAGLLLGLAGVVVLVGVDVHGTSTAAVLELFGCAIGYAGAPIIVNRFLADVPAFEVVASSVALTALVYLPFGVTHLPSRLSAEAAWSVVALSIVCTVIAFMFFFALIRSAGPTRAVVVTYLNPAVALLLGVVVLNEPFTSGIAIGFPMILLGSILGTWTRAPAVGAGRALRAESSRVGAETTSPGRLLPADIERVDPGALGTVAAPSDHRFD
jgi:drug/metabolite transporter (DMT)-like permease